jgi:hypothetical protein
VTTETQQDRWFYDYKEFRTAFWSEDRKSKFDMWDHLHHVEDSCWKLCSVMAPWSSKLGSHVEYGVFCEACAADVRGKKNVPLIAKENGEDGCQVGYPDPKRIPFLTVEQLEEHNLKEHT